MEGISFVFVVFHVVFRKSSSLNQIFRFPGFGVCLANFKVLGIGFQGIEAFVCVCVCVCVGVCACVCGWFGVGQTQVEMKE
jgi:hypothetical protein